jgi:peptidoglycan/LPS O-acetylase OafA/YrhL
MLPRELAKWVAASVYACGWGVDLFFALSSYLITELLIREQQRSQRIDVRAFYLRRALRIWPLYYAFLTFTLTVAPKLIPDEQLSIPHRIGFTFFGANWTIARYGWPPSVASPLWSVSIEEQFYAVWPLIIKYLGIQRIPKVAAAMLITSLLTRVALVLAGVAHPGIYANVFARLDPIAAGALLAVGLRGNSPGLSVRQRVLMGMLAMAMTVVVTRYGGFDGPRSLVSYPAVTAASILIICAFLHREEAVPAWLRNQLLIQLGRMSYGLYVFHQFSLAYVKTFLQPVDRPAKLATYMGGGLVLTGLLAGLSYRYIERPLLALKDRFAVVQSRRV